MKSAVPSIDVVGADANNLADIAVQIPREAVTAIVGPSGSGKSSLVEDTIAAEAADRMHRFLDIDLGRLRGTAVRGFVGQLPPTLFAGQRAFRASSRTTVGTCTGLHRVLRRLFIKFSRPFADDIKEEVDEPSPGAFGAWLLRHAKGRAIVWAVPVRNQAINGVTAVRRLLAAGLTEAIVRSETDRGARAENGRTIALASFEPLRTDVRHTIEARIGEVALVAASRAKLQTFLEHAWAAANGAAFIELPDTDRPDLRGAFTYGLDTRVHRVHPDSSMVYAVADQNRLSFNAPKHAESGACGTCLGLGQATVLDEASLIEHPDRSVHAGALALWTPKNYKYVNIQHTTIEGLRGRQGFDPDVVWRKLSPSARALVLDGSMDLVEDRDLKTRKKASAPHHFPGFRQAILEKAGRPTPAGEALRRYVRMGPCDTCGGTRWSAQTRALRVAGWSIDRVLALPLSRLAAETDSGRFAKDSPPQARNLVANLQRMATALVSVGLGHLSGDRGMLDISDGESRRVRLAAVLTSRLAGLLLVLDEPARGLHEEDLEPLGNAILAAARVHTVVMSEHRQRLVARAHHLIELGPGAGPHGGRVTYAGPVAESSWARPDRLTCSDASLSNSRAWLEINGVHVHNVVDAAVRLPLGAITCIAGVSGSGKSSFVRGALVPALARTLPPGAVDIEDFRTRDGRWNRLRGAEGITALHAMDQSGAPAQRRSLVATFLGVAEPLRDAFAAEPVARKLGLLARDFGTNAGRGRCQRCLGLGALEEDGGECPVCGGLRFGIDVLSVRSDGFNLAELLGEPIEALCDRAHPAIPPAVLLSIVELGIGYLTFGRSFDTLSGGEIQRLRIARALLQPESAGALFVLDEPAGGLHPNDVKRLEQALRHIVSDGANTVVLVEHDPHLLATCDHIVEFGPGGGPDGGFVVAMGPPSQVKGMNTPTGRALRPTRASSPKAGLVTAEHVSDATTRAIAERARAEIRQILGDDVEVPEDDGGKVAPAAIPSATWGQQRPYELADLDISILQVLLDGRGNTALDLHALAKTWQSDPALHLEIQPLLDALAIWGDRIPRSAVAQVNEHLLTMGLGPKVTDTGDVRRARVTGERFIPKECSIDGHLAAIRDAWALGGGYIELVDKAGRVRHCAQDRLLDLDGGRAGPRHPTPAHFRRFDPRGACPMCRGTGTVTAIDPNLVVRKRSLGVLDEKSLDPRAAAVLKGERRSNMIPFFDRLAKEGLWHASARWSTLDPRAEATVMHGFWIRPGHGTFVKMGRDIDGSEVKHWLRWDGLVAALDAQIERSDDAPWREAVRSSRHHVGCPSCKGTGLGAASSLLDLDGVPFDRWIREQSLAPFLKAIESIKKLPHRAARIRQRLIECLTPLRNSDPPLLHPVLSVGAYDVVARTTKAFTGMSLIGGV